jgi:predicted CXXCH cytochrome family protein
MKTQSPQDPSKTRSKRSSYFLILLGSIAVVIFAISCETINHIVIAPPQIPGATFIGAQECATCHEDIAKSFKTATHSRLQAKTDNAEAMGCEGCHGAGSIHAESGGKKGTIVNPRKSPETCFQCHLDKRGEFNLPHHHPVLEGKVSCGDCHDPHKGPAIKGGSTSIASENETCFKCHTAQKGPFIFEHEALREGCTVCHAVHGSVNARMLHERNANLCLKCHFQEQTAEGQIMIGGSNHATRLNQGTCFSGDCHEGVHGSNVNSSQRR